MASVDVSPTAYYTGVDKLVVSQQYLQSAAQKLVPLITASIDNTKLSQAPLSSPDTGKPLASAGSAKVVDPCTAFTTADFQSIVNGQEDDSEVASIVPNSPVAQAPKTQQLQDGRSNATCSRKGYVSTPQPDPASYVKDPQGFFAAQKAYAAVVKPTVTATYQFYNSSDEAVQGGNEKVAGVKGSYEGAATTPVNGVGDRAILIDYHTVSQDAGTAEYNNPQNHEVHLYVVKGAYLIDIMINYAPDASASDQSTGHTGTPAQYAKAGQLLAAQLH